MRKIQRHPATNSNRRWRSGPRREGQTIGLLVADAIYLALVLPHPLVVTAVLAGLATRRWLPPVLAAAGFLLIMVMQLWDATMQSLAVVLPASVVAIVIGVPIGIAAAQMDRVRTLIRPVLDFMQTLPVFVYLLPAVFFFGIGVVPGVVATTIFAIPPAVRLTELGIRQVDSEVVEAAVAFGSRPRQVLRDVQLPLAMPSIMAGVNQVIMLALSMMVIAGMVGGGGLGAVVVQAVTTLDIGKGFEGGPCRRHRGHLSGSRHRGFRCQRCPAAPPPSHHHLGEG
jgi:glycine betaine/proline transport system permease protein